MTNFDDIRSAAEDMFGADNVDVQNVFSSRPCLVIHWDEVEVSNEEDERHTIYDLFARVNLNPDASMIGFELTRTSLTPAEMIRGYIFSHVSSQHGNVLDYKKPCLGTGPIRTTITTLSAGYDPDIFRLFLLELDRYVRTESITGGPYVRIREITKQYQYPYRLNNISLNISVSNESKRLYKYMMKTRPIEPVLCDRNHADFGLMIPLVCRITDAALDYLRHKECYQMSDIDTYLTKCSLRDGMIYISTVNSPAISGNIRTRVFFKGDNVEFRRVGDGCGDDDEQYVIIPDIAKDIVVLLYRDYFLKKHK